MSPTDRNIDGKEFIKLTREDISLIYPSKDKFLLASRLYKLSQQIQKSGNEDSDIEYRNTGSLLEEMSDITSTPSSSRCSTPSSLPQKHKIISQPLSAKKSRIEKENCLSQFKLPHFPPEIKLCIKTDSFYTTSQRNKLIKEGCLALRGYCWNEEREVSNIDKRKLAKTLCELAPKSLSDPTNETRPEVSVVIL